MDDHYAKTYGRSGPQTCFMFMPRLGRHPVSMTCPNCHEKIVIATISEISPIAWIIFGILCLTVVGIYCSWVPLCMGSLRDVIHTCPNCKVFLGISKIKQITYKYTSQFLNSLNFSDLLDS